ncbi:hypothetical protein PENTCL1PPCAC_7968, partial [Pristionchus entomophagus]
SPSDSSAHVPPLPPLLLPPPLFFRLSRLFLPPRFDDDFFDLFFFFLFFLYSSSFARLAVSSSRPCSVPRSFSLASSLSIWSTSRRVGLGGTSIPRLSKYCLIHSALAPLL